MLRVLPCLAILGRVSVRFRRVCPGLTFRPPPRVAYILLNALALITNGINKKKSNAQWVDFAV